jgi:hypothetical protein
MDSVTETVADSSCPEGDRKLDSTNTHSNQRCADNESSDGRPHEQPVKDLTESGHNCDLMKDQPTHAGNDSSTNWKLKCSGEMDAEGSSANTNVKSTDVTDSVVPKLWENPGFAADMTSEASSDQRNTVEFPPVFRCCSFLILILFTMVCLIDTAVVVCSVGRYSLSRT